MKTKKLYYPSTMFSGEVILSNEHFNTEKEAMEHTDKVYPDVDWTEYQILEDGNLGMVVGSSYYHTCPWMYGYNFKR